jgi:hypothetical protein
MKTRLAAFFYFQVLAPGFQWCRWPPASAWSFYILDCQSGGVGGAGGFAGRFRHKLQRSGPEDAADAACRSNPLV